MVHSDVIFWLRKVCKRRRFLSDLVSRLFLSQSSQNPFQPVLMDSGGLSLPPLTEPSAGANRLTLPQESGNMETRPLPSGGPSKRSMCAHMVCTPVTVR